MKKLKMAAWCLALCALTPMVQANTAVCTANTESDCKKVRVFVTADGAGCKAEVEFDKILLRHGGKNHKIVYVLDKQRGDKADYFFDQVNGITVLEDKAGQAFEREPDASDKRKRFKITSRNDRSDKYVIAYIASVLRDGPTPVACEAVDPTIENH